MKKTLRSLEFAFNGILELIASQLNAKIHLLLLATATALGFALHLQASEWLWIIGASGLVLMAEAFNTAIEYLTDIVSPQYSEKAGKVKDLAAGAVLLSAITAVAIGSIIFIPKFLGL